ncbi:MAG: flagellar basal-body MS-ring/collar protein FliF [Alphaproteobacteria bacterium]
MEQMLETWHRLDPRRRIILAGAAIPTVVAVLSLAQVATRPGMALLYSGLDPAAAGEVVGALEQMNVRPEVRGNAVYVAEDERDRVRLALARDGLPRQGQSGYELLDQLSGFSATTDMFNAAYWRAKEGELARTILATSGVRAARVHIAAPSRRPFARGAAGASASVTVTMSGGVLTQAQATAIRYLVALAVAELGPGRVAVIDSRAGMVLAPGTDTPATNAAGEAADREARLKAEIEQLLTARVGRDKARVSVTVETDREAETVTEKLFQPDTRVVISTDTEEISDTSSGSAGSVTVASNLPDGDTGASDTRSSERSESRERANYDYSEIQRQTVRQAGAIRRISVAVLVDGITTTGVDGEPVWEPRPEAELKTLRNLVVAAIGFDEARGDIVTVESMAFQPDATPGALVESSPLLRLLERNAMTLIQIGVLSSVALVLALMVVRPILTRPMPARTAVGEIAGLAPAAGELSRNDALAAPDQPGLPVPEDGENRPASGGEALRLAVTERPEQTVSMLREWLTPTELAPGEEEVV